MNQHDREAHKNRSIQSPAEIFRFPTRAEMLQAQAKEQEQEQEQKQKQAQSKPVASNYQDEDLSGCLSGFLKPREIAQPKPVESNYQDEDLSGCLSGFLKLREVKPQVSQRERFTPTKRDNTTGEITPIERDDLSGEIAPLDEDKSGWLYFN
jgi:hypothetical protein